MAAINKHFLWSKLIFLNDIHDKNMMNDLFTDIVKIIVKISKIWESN